MTSHSVRDLAAGLRPSVEARALQTDIRFVEFFGLPGIGKTTASSLLANGLQRCCPLVGNVQIAWETRTFVGRQIYRIGIVASRFKDPQFRSLLARIARFVMEGGQSSIVDMIRVIWNLSFLVAYVQSKRSGKNTITIMDQGLLQGFLSILLKSRHRPTSETWRDILFAIGVHDMVFVHLRGEIGVARDRLLKRGDRSSRMQRTSPDRELDLWSTADRACREFAAHLEGGMRTEDHVGILAAVDVERQELPEEVAERVLEAVLLACLERHRLCDQSAQ
ncbi:hypothetical protein EN829_017660 [Mesorhizobium sp. M00.F.Ca.ET.186.01.1.1]|nr:hypothetical protein EN848_16875 [bacterium M00.F.Ca.ET.205.01.1.1]TGU52262.1 hypothetical protein EN795_16425 [bacterium M00.F.Ca.ET.152.01.1.1]TGV35058.1 hypothetical protein EN829_017660 [Mesorhizobium sp. M00.F.Ca.ET.186.01.1.1]TGZ43012.1 hypothetical protein EN805_13230 [bacterium M00.F.Ca.ET.162.01.1.1]